jgi:hypothetical protein
MNFWNTEQIQDTLGNVQDFADQYVGGEQAPESEVYVVSDEEISRRKKARLIFVVSSMTLVGLTIIYLMRK